MLRVLLWAVATIVVILAAYLTIGGHIGIVFSRFELMIILAMVVGVSAASGRLMVWGTIARDLRQAGRPDPAAPITTLTADTLGERRRRVLATVDDARIAAMVGGVLAALLGVIRLCHDVGEPPEIQGDMLGHAFAAILAGLLVAYGILAPLGARLADIYDRALFAMTVGGSQPAVEKSQTARAVASMLAVLLVVLMAGGAFDWLLAMVGLGSRHASPGPHLVELPEITANLYEDGGTRILKARIWLQLPESSNAGDVEARMPRVVNSILGYLSDQHVKDLQGEEAMTRRREDLRIRINALIQPAQASDVLLTEILVQ